MEQSKVRRIEPLVLTRSTRAVQPQAASDPAVDGNGASVGEGDSGNTSLKIKLTRKRPVEAIVEAVLPTEEATEEKGGDNDTEMTGSEVDVEEGGKEGAQTGGKESSSNKGDDNEGDDGEDGAPSRQEKGRRPRHKLSAATQRFRAQPGAVCGEPGCMSCECNDPECIKTNHPSKEDGAVHLCSGARRPHILLQLCQKCHGFQSKSRRTGDRTKARDDKVVTRGATRNPNLSSQIGASEINGGDGLLPDEYTSLIEYEPPPAVIKLRGEPKVFNTESKVIKLKMSRKGAWCNYNTCRTCECNFERCIEVNHKNGTLDGLHVCLNDKGNGTDPYCSLCHAFLESYKSYMVEKLTSKDKTPHRHLIDVYPLEKYRKATTTAKAIKTIGKPVIPVMRKALYNENSNTDCRDDYCNTCECTEPLCIKQNHPRSADGVHWCENNRRKEGREGRVVGKSNQRCRSCHNFYYKHIAQTRTSNQTSSRLGSGNAWAPSQSYRFVSRYPDDDEENNENEPEEASSDEESIPSQNARPSTSAAASNSRRSGRERVDRDDDGGGYHQQRQPYSQPLRNIPMNMPPSMQLPYPSNAPPLCPCDHPSCREKNHIHGGRCGNRQDRVGVCTRCFTFKVNEAKMAAMSAGGSQKHRVQSMPPSYPGMGQGQGHPHMGHHPPSYSYVMTPQGPMYQMMAPQGHMMQQGSPMMMQHMSQGGMPHPYPGHMPPHYMMNPHMPHHPQYPYGYPPHMTGQMGYQGGQQHPHAMMQQMNPMQQQQQQAMYKQQQLPSAAQNVPTATNKAPTPGGNLVVSGSSGVVAVTVSTVPPPGPTAAASGGTDTKLVGTKATPIVIDDDAKSSSSVAPASVPVPGTVAPAPAVVPATGNPAPTSEICKICNIDTDDDKVLLCDGCDLPFHTYCAKVDAVPEGDWYCASCAKKAGKRKRPDDGSTSGSNKRKK